MAKLTTQKRKALPASTFAGPNRSYPIPDRKHGQLAKAFASRYASPAEKASIDAKVKRRFGFAKGGMAPGGAMPDAGKEPDSDEICVPMKEVEMNGVQPSVGDTIQVPATVTRIAGANVYAVPKGMDSDEDDNQSETLDQTRQRLMAGASGPQDTDNPGY